MGVRGSRRRDRKQSSLRSGRPRGFRDARSSPSHTRRSSDEDRVLRTIFKGTAEETGSAFFQTLVRAVAEALDVKGAWVSEFTDGSERLRALPFWMDEEFVEDFEYDVAGTPCEGVVRECRLVHVPDRVVDLYPGDP